MNFLSKYQNWAWVMLFIPIYLFIFLKLGSAHIRLWDEGWFTVHAIEMLQNGSWFTSYFDGVPSFKSSKPPIQTWLQMGSISLFGLSELSLRLPSAIAAAATVFSIYFFVSRHSTVRQGLMSSMILLTSVGYVGFHTARGAEADSLLTLTLVLQAICLYEFLLRSEWKWFYGFALCLAISFWVKSVAGFLFLPGFAIFIAVYRRDKMLNLIRSKQLWIAVAGVISAVLAFLIIRENVQPGYLAMFLKSNAGRYAKSVGHDHGWDYYLKQMLDGRYHWWMVIAVIGFASSLLEQNADNLLSIFASVVAFSFLAVISFSRSKLLWYDMPFYPMAAIPAAAFIERIVKNRSFKYSLTAVVLVFFFPSYVMFSNSQSNRLNLGELNFESQEIYLSESFHKGESLDGLIVVHDHFHGSLLFYKYKYASSGQELVLQNHVNDLKVGDEVLVRGDEHKTELQSKFHLEKIDEKYSAIHYKITEFLLDNPVENEVNSIRR